MDSFEDWLKTVNHPSMEKWGDHILELGASWNSFRRDQNSVISDLVSEGIPRLFAYDIYKLTTEEINRNQAPMSIFWDIENVPIPRDVSGRDVALQLK